MRWNSHLITVSNIPSNDSSLLDYSDQLSESLGHNGAREHASTAEQDVVGVVLNRCRVVGSDISAYCLLIQTWDSMSLNLCLGLEI